MLLRLQKQIRQKIQTISMHLPVCTPIVPDTALTNGFDNFYLTNKIGFAYRFNNQKLNWMWALMDKMPYCKAIS